MNRFNHLYKLIITVLFIAFLGTLILLSILMPTKAFSQSENRMLQQFPKFTFKRLTNGRFTSEWEKYVTDQIALRDFWVGVKAKTDMSLGKRDNNDVYLGDGYLLQKFDRYDEKDLKTKVEAIDAFSKDNHDVKTYFMLVPNAVKVLEQKLPPFASPQDQLKFIDKVKKGLDKNIHFVEVCDPLLAHKDEYIFYRTDHHWTTDGAYYGYEAFAKASGFSPHGKDYFNITEVTDTFYGSLYSKSGFRNVKPDSIRLYLPKTNEGINLLLLDKNEKHDTIYKMDNLHKKDKYTVFFDGNHPLMKITTNSEQNKKLLIIKDSFANSFIPFLTGHYEEIYIVDLRYYNESISELVESNGIKEVLILYSVNTFSEDNTINRIAW